MAKLPKTFEQEVRAIVGRGSRSSSNEEAIQEVVAHYVDLVQEGISKGLPESQANLEATKRIGSPTSIALQILSSPGLKTKGSRAQAVGIAGLVLSAIQMAVLGYCSVRQITSNFVTLSYFETVVLYLLSASVMGYGVLFANKVQWKQLTFSTAFVFFMWAMAYTKFEKILWTYRSQSAPQTKIYLSSNWAWSASAQFTAMFLTTFSAIALVIYLLGKIWILRSYWFRFTKA